MFALWRLHAVFTDTALALVDAERTHRAHAVVELVFADLEDSALAHLPSGRFTANAGAAPGRPGAQRQPGAGYARVRVPREGRTGTVRRQLVAVPARLAFGGRALTFHLPERWQPWQNAFAVLRTAVGCWLRT